MYMNQKRKVNGGRAVMSEAKWKMTSAARRGAVEGGIWVAKLIYMLTIQRAARKLLLLPTPVDGRVWEVISA